MLGISFVLAVPVAWYVIVLWLERFAYKVSVPWLLFPLAGLVVLLISASVVSIRSLKAAKANPVDVMKNE